MDIVIKMPLKHWFCLSGFTFYILFKKTIYNLLFSLFSR